MRRLEGKLCPSMHEFPCHRITTVTQHQGLFVSIYLKLDPLWTHISWMRKDQDFGSDSDIGNTSPCCQQLRYSWITLSDLSDMADPRQPTPKWPPGGMGVVRTRLRSFGALDNLDVRGILAVGGYNTIYINNIQYIVTFGYPCNIMFVIISVICSSNIECLKMLKIIENHNTIFQSKVTIHTSQDSFQCSVLQVRVLRFHLAANFTFQYRFLETGLACWIAPSLHVGCC